MTIGRVADIVIDETNKFLHRSFLEVAAQESVCLLRNVGTQLSATVSDEHRRMQAWLAPTAVLPLVFSPSFVRFTAGPTSYELVVELASPLFAAAIEARPVSGDTTAGSLPLTTEQRLLIVALAEPLLRTPELGRVIVPSSAEAAKRLGWAPTKFNRKLDYLCEKLERAGVRGLHGAPGDLASNRRARLVEYALAVGLVDPDDLALLAPSR